MKAGTFGIPSVPLYVSSRLGLVVVVFAMLLTASFVGVVGLLTGAPLAAGERLPAYVLVMGLVFVASMLRLDSPDRDGVRVLIAVSSLSLASFVLSALSMEGVFFTMMRPDLVIESWLLLSLGAAALVCSGVLTWLFHHWREFASGQRRQATWHIR